VNRVGLEPTLRLIPLLELTPTVKLVNLPHSSKGVRPFQQVAEIGGRRGGKFEFPTSVILYLTMRESNENED
jgi:hypothetical protein